MFDFQQKRGEIVKKETGLRIRREGRGRRMLSVILIASAPTEPWPIAEYFSVFLIKTDKTSSMCLLLHRPVIAFAMKPILILGDVFGVHSPPTTANFIGFSYLLQPNQLVVAVKKSGSPAFLSGDRR